MKPRRMPLQSRRFGRLLVLEYVDNDSSRSSRWKCLCDCGNEFVVRGSHLHLGQVQSCGCFKIERTKEVNSVLARTHGHCSGGELSPTYQSWRSMIDRCRIITHQAFHRYGGRGIKVCERWQRFENFLEDMGERPKGKTIDRYPNNDGNYEPSNCRWATIQEQLWSRRESNATSKSI